jgi:phosphatidate cytidylyltransferase
VLVTRLATAAVGIPLIVLAVWAGGPWLAGLVALAVFVAVVELAMARGLPLPFGRLEPGSNPEEAGRLYGSTGGGFSFALLSGIAAAALPALALAGEGYVLAGVVAAIVLVSGLLTLTRAPVSDLPHWLWGMASGPYFGVLAAYFVLVRELPNGRDLAFFALLTVWITDTGAYAVGRAIGRHKLAPAVSPGKTWEGSAGSVVAGMAAVFVLNELLDLELGATHLGVLGLLLPIVIMVGDLAESALKRGLEIKDSSGLVPGHGGVADRLDSLLFAFPAVYYYLKWIVA